MTTTDSSSGTALSTASSATARMLSTATIARKKFGRCRECYQRLIPGENWPESRQKRYDYICAHCKGSARNATRERFTRANAEFRAVDGEGGNVAEPGTLFGLRHQYLSLRVGPELLETGNPLLWEECLGFLADQDPHYIYVAYFFDYDVTMIIRTFPEERAKRLLNRHLRMDKNGNCLPLDIGDFQVDYLQHKEFKVRRKGTRHWMIINDVGQFFQSSFLKTLEKWNIGTPDEREMIRRGKSMRAEFAGHTEEIAAYNALECVLLEQLMTEFRSVCEDTGYVPNKWQGPGNLASAMLKRHGIPRRDDIPILRNNEFRALAQEAYYGGRFETTAAGPVSGPVFQYDINGAYVAALRTLPCLTHGSWKHTDTQPRDGLWFGAVHFNHPSGDESYLYNLPVRLANGNIFYPREGNGVYWSEELSAASKHDTDVAFKHGWVYENHCECRWFGFVDDYYAERLRLGKSAKGYVLKLAGNSIYGKLAQSIGYAPWANPAWAGIITASCRAQIVEGYSQSPRGTYMIATDGLFTDRKLDLPVSRELGEWEETVHPNGIFIVQPGIYFAGDEPKSRGVERGVINTMRSQFEGQWTKFEDSRGLDYTVDVPVTNFITARQAVARNKWKLAGTWETTERAISYYWGTKRKSGIAWHDGTNLRTIPHNGAPDLQSVPYARTIGGGLVVPDEERYSDLGLVEAARMEAQPDWVEPLFTAPESL